MQNMRKQSDGDDAIRYWESWVMYQQTGKQTFRNSHQTETDSTNILHIKAVEYVAGSVKLACCYCWQRPTGDVIVGPDNTRGTG